MAIGVGSYGKKKTDPIWKFMERANKLLQEVADEIRRAGIHLEGNISPRLELDHSDRVLAEITRTDFKGANPEYRISVNYRLATCTDQEIKETLAHEICHASIGAWTRKTYFQSHAKRDALAHTGIWLENMKKLNSLYGYSISATGNVKKSTEGNIYF